MNTQTLYRPVGPQELALIRAFGMREFPPRLPEQPIFYPVLNEAYATQIARDWNVPASGSGFVTRFAVRSEHVAKYPVRRVGGGIHDELWVPAGELAEFNRNIVGPIEVIAEFYAAPQRGDATKPRASDEGAQPWVADESAPSPERAGQTSAPDVRRNPNT